MSEKNIPILEQVRNLLDIAQHPNTGAAERELAMKQADRLKRRHAIDEAMLEASRSATERTQPIFRRLRLFDGAQAFGPKFVTVLVSVASANRCAVVRISGSREYNTELFGFPSDVDYCEQFITGAFMTYVAALFPTWNPQASLGENAYNMTQAGYKWEAIRDHAVANGLDIPWPDGGKIHRARDSHCKLHGLPIERHTQRHGAYRESFADAFVARLCGRIEEFVREGKQEARAAGAELVLADRTKDVMALLYGEHPEMSPEAQRLLRAEEDRRYQESILRQREAREAMLAGMTERQRTALYEKEERQRQREAKADDRYWEKWQRTIHTDATAARRGRAAADSVNVTRTAGGVRTDTGKEAIDG